MHSLINVLRYSHLCEALSHPAVIRQFSTLLLIRHLVAHCHSSVLWFLLSCLHMTTGFSSRQAFRVLRALGLAVGMNYH